MSVRFTLSTTNDSIMEKLVISLGFKMTITNDFDIIYVGCESDSKRVNDTLITAGFDVSKVVFDF